jgi:CheY-like chemotaxis protein
MNLSFRVLVFDDDDGVRMMTHALLGRRGFEVFSYSDPVFHPLHQCPGGLCEGAGACADAIVTDLDMPVTNGLDFIGELKRRGCRVPHMAIVTGNASAKALAEASALGCPVFEKPVGLFSMLQWLVALAADTPADRQLTDLSKLALLPGPTAAQLRPNGPRRSQRQQPLLLDCPG